MNRTATRRRGAASVLLLGASLVASLLVPDHVARAATMTVCATGCDHTSVQTAIDASSPGDIIVLAAETFAETISVDRDLTIRGAGPSSSTIDGGAASSVVTVLPGVSLRLEQLGVRNGRTVAHGGGVFNEGVLLADAVLVSGNVASTVAVSAGGGIYSSGQLTLTNSTVSGNESQVGGGGVYVSGPSATAQIVDTELSGNVVRDLTTDFRGGGGLHVVHGDATVIRTRIVENSTDFTGGGVTVRGSNSDVEIVDSTIHGNTSTSGAGIRTQSSSRLILRGSTVSNNTAGRGGSASGGGLRAGASVTISNSTFVGNAAVAGGSFNSAGGAITADSSVTLDSVTIAGNSADFGGGVSSFSGTTLVTNVILAGNSAATAANGNDCAGTLAGGDALLIGDATGCTLSAVTGVGSGDPLLGPLQDNGGPTRTLEPQAGSPAVDAGATALTLDQRGFTRPVGSAPDIGAVEVQSAGVGAPVIESIADRSVDEGQLIEITPIVSDAEGDPFSLSWEGLPAGSSTVGGTFSWTPAEDQAPGGYAITVRATQDGAPTLFDDETFTIDVAEVNAAPILDPITDATVAAGDTLTFDVTASDPDMPPNLLVFTLVEGPPGATLDAASGAFSWLACACPGNHPLEVSVSDGELTDTATATITVGDGTGGEPPGGGHFFPPAGNPSIGWQNLFPMAELDSARLLGEVVVIASAGDVDPVLQLVAPEAPTTIDIDADGNADITVTISLTPGPGISPAVVMSVDRLADPGLEDVQVLALVPLPEELPTDVGKASLAVGVGTAAPGGGAGGFLPESEVITASVDEIGGLTHRIRLSFETTNEINPLVFYMGTAEGNARDIGADAANLLAIQTSPVPSRADLLLSVDIGALSAPDPAGSATLEWATPTGEPDADLTFFYLESERVPRGTAADVELVGVVEDADPITRLTLSLVPDETLELALFHNDPSNDPPNGTFFDTIDRIQVEYRQPGFDLRAGLIGLTGPDLRVTVDDGSGDLTVTNSTRFELEFEASRPGRGFFGGAFGHPLDWIFVSASDFTDLVVRNRGDGGSDVLFSDRFGPGSDLILVAADDPGNLRFPQRQQLNWPNTHPSTWPHIATGDAFMRLGLVDDDDGTTLAIRTNDTPSLRFDFAADSLAQTIAIDAPFQTGLDIDVELGPRLGLAEGAVLGCDALLRRGSVAVEVQPPSTYGFLSGGGTDLQCYGENGVRRVIVTADEFPERMTAELNAGEQTGELVFTAVDATLADDPVDDLHITLMDTVDGLTGEEPLGAPAQLLDLSAESLPSTLISWEHRPEGDLDLEIQATSAEERIRELVFMLVTVPEAIDLEGEPTFTPSFDPPPRGGGQRRFMPAGEISVYLWELPQMTMLAAGVDLGRRLAATIGAEGDSTVELDVSDDAVAEMPLVVDLALSEGGHFVPAASVHGWCDLRLPLSTITFTAQLPDSFTLETDASVPFSQLVCRQRISMADSALDADVLVDAHVLPDGTSLRMDLPARTVSLTAGGASIADLFLDVQDRSGDGLPVDAPFSNPIGALGVRFDGVESLTASWLFEQSPGDGVPGSLLIDFLAAGADAVQFRVTTDSVPDPLSTVPATHRLELVDEGPDGVGLARVALRDLEHAQVRHDPRLPHPLNVEIGSTQPNDLALDVRLDFDSPLTLADSRTGTRYQIDATGLVRDVARTILFSTNLEQRHIVNGAVGADVSAHIVLDDDPTDEEEDADPAMEVYLLATDLPASFGLDAYNFDPLNEAGDPLFIELTAPLPMLDIVLLEPRAAGVLGSGSNRVRVHAEVVPSQLQFTFDSQLDDDGTGPIEFRGSASGRIGRLLFEADNFGMGADETHFGTPFGRITADLTDVAPNFAVEVETETHPDVQDARSLGASLVFSDGPVPATGPELNDRIGRAEVILETVNPGPGEDRGLPLQTYADGSFTGLERSTFVRQVDDGYWPAGVRDRLALSEARVALVTTPATPIPAADGQGGTTKTQAVDDYVILGDPLHDGGWSLIALQVSNVHRVLVDSAPPELDAQVVRPAATVAPPLYLAVESIRWPDFDDPATKPQAGNPDKDAPQVKDDVAAYLYTGVARDERIVNVLANDPDLSAAANFIVTRQPAHGSIGFDFRTVRGERTRVLVYEPTDPHRVGWDLALYAVCTAAGACAEARVDILITDQYVGGVFGRVVGPPNELSVFTTGHLELRLGELLEEGLAMYGAVVDRLGYSASSAPIGLDLFNGPRIEPPKSVVSAQRVHAIAAPNSLTWHATHPDSYLFRYKADATGPFDLAGVVRTQGGLTRFGAKGNGGFELGGAATGFIGQAITGERTPEDFRGCDRIFGKIDTCVAILGINVQGTADDRLDGYFSYAPRTETTEPARRNGAADFEYVPLITLLADDLRRISGGAQLQFDPIRFGTFASGPFQVESGVSVVARQLKLDVWARGAIGAKLLLSTIGTFDIPLGASYLTGIPFPVTFALPFDPYP